MKAEIDMGTVVDALILLKQQRKAYRMWADAEMSNLPNGFKIEDLNNVIESLENVKLEARDFCQQMVM